MYGLVWRISFTLWIAVGLTLYSGFEYINGYCKHLNQKNNYYILNLSTNQFWNEICL